MKKLATLLLTALLIAALSAAAFASPAGENKGNLPQTAAELTLDGVKDAAYNEAFTLSFNRTNENNPVDEQGKAYLVWTEGETTDYLWCYVEIKDTDLSYGEGEFYARDSVEFFVNFANSDADTELMQYIIDAGGNSKYYSGPLALDVTVPGALGVATTVEKDGTVYFSGSASQSEGTYAVEYCIPCDLSVDQEVAVLLTAHNLPSWAWFITEGSMPFVNWNPGCMDYVVVKGLASAEQPDAPATGDATIAAIALLCAASAGAALVLGKKRA